MGVCDLRVGFLFRIVGLYGVIVLLCCDFGFWRGAVACVG